MGGHPALWMGIFHTDFGTIAVVSKFRLQESADAPGAMDRFFQSGFWLFPVNYRSIYNSVASVTDGDQTWPPHCFMLVLSTSRVMIFLFLAKPKGLRAVLCIQHYLRPPTLLVPIKNLLISQVPF